MQTINGNCIFENLNFSFEGNEMLKSNVSLAVWHKSNTVMRDKLVGRNLNVLTNTSFNDISDHEQIVHIVIMNKKGSKIVGNLSLYVVLKRPISYENDNVVEVAAECIQRIQVEEFSRLTAAAATTTTRHSSSPSKSTSRRCYHDVVHREGLR